MAADDLSEKDIVCNETSAIPRLIMRTVPAVPASKDQRGGGMKPGMGDARRIDKQTKILDDLSRAGYEFMMSDLDLALTLTRIASRAAEDEHKRIRNLQNARRAYDKVQELLQRVGLSGTQQQQQIVEKLDTVKSALKSSRVFLIRLSDSKR